MLMCIRGTPIWRPENSVNIWNLSLRSLAVFKQFECAKKGAKLQGAWERDNWENACTDDRHFLLVQYAGVRAIAIGSED